MKDEAKEMTAALFEVFYPDLEAGTLPPMQAIGALMHAIAAVVVTMPLDEQATAVAVVMNALPEAVAEVAAQLAAGGSGELLN